MASPKAVENDFNRIRRKHKFKGFLRSLLALVIVLALVATAYFSQQLWMPYFERVLERTEVLADRELTAAEIEFPYDVSKKVNVKIGTTEDSFVMFSDTSLTTYDRDGKRLYSEYLSYANPVLETVSSRAMAYDQSGTSLTVITKKDNVFSLKLSDKILLARLGASGNIAVVTSTDKYPAYLTVYDKKGKEVYNWAAGNLITAVALGSSGSKALVSETYVRGGAFKSAVTLLDIDKEKSQTAASSVDTLALAIEFTSDGGFWIVGDTALYRYSSDYQLKYSYDYQYDISAFSVKDDLCALMFDSIDGKSATLCLFRSSTEEPAEIKYNEKVHFLRISDKRVYLNTSTKIYCLNNKGEVVFSDYLDSEYASFDVTDEDAYLVNYRCVNKLELGGK